MANSKQAAKRARQRVKRTLHNSSLRSRMRTFVKKVNKLAEIGDKQDATDTFSVAVRQIDKLVNKKLIHANKAARMKSRLVKRLKAIA
ncbi:MAG: 30S ribosomal protein S20 [Gammaproteobacteria bacterium RIFCSPHIGHO2_12_FULL_41_15]|nr:MAG: 30S ribosomal protein S20 [Gammaproteobacteria bacterium RIFCSPHIGHO2_12_FULL_41_15]